jgi:F-type H+-transporting ATPase subunit b
MISINATLLVQLINLLVLIFLLNQLMYKPIKRIAQERERKMAEALAEAQGVEDSTRQGWADYEAKRAQEIAQVRERLAQAKSQADHRAMQMRAEAQEKAKHQQAAMLSRVEEEMEAARREVRAEAEKVARDMAGRVLGREVS